MVISGNHHSILEQSDDVGAAFLGVGGPPQILAWWPTDAREFYFSTTRLDTHTTYLALLSETPPASDWVLGSPWAKIFKGPYRSLSEFRYHDHPYPSNIKCTSEIIHCDYKFGYLINLVKKCRSGGGWVGLGSKGRQEIFPH